MHPSAAVAYAASAARGNAQPCTAGCGACISSFSHGREPCLPHHFPRLQFGNAGRTLATAGLAIAGGSGVAFASGEDHVEPPQYPWSHKGPFSTFDAAA
jgi:hypothetical protein